MFASAQFFSTLSTCLFDLQSKIIGGTQDRNVHFKTDCILIMYSGKWGSSRGLVVRVLDSGL